MGVGEPEVVINIGVSGPGVVKRAIERARQLRPDLDLQMLAEEIKLTAFRVTRVGELIGREVAAELGVAFGIVDLSLAPTPKVGDCIGEILQALGIEKIGAPGSTAAIALLNDAVKKGGLFASSSVGGLSGAFIPVGEDSTLADAAETGLPVAGEARGHDQRLLAGAGHGLHPRRHRSGHDRRDHRRRDGDRRDQPQDSGDAADPGAGQEGRRVGALGRPVRLIARARGAGGRCLGRLCDAGRPHPAPRLVAAELTIGLAMRSLKRRLLPDVPSRPMPLLRSVE